MSQNDCNAFSCNSGDTIAALFKNANQRIDTEDKMNKLHSLYERGGRDKLGN